VDTPSPPRCSATSNRPGGWSPRSTADGATPAWAVQPVGGTVQYREGTYIGYRGHHAGHAPAPAFWFGHGLGYGAWEYTDVRLTGLDDGIPEVSLTMHNTADRRSREVVQLYFDPADAAEPVRLVGWTGVDVDAGGAVDVTVTADRRMWRSWDPQAHSWNRLTGGGRILVARGLGDVELVYAHALGFEHVLQLREAVAQELGGVVV